MASNPCYDGREHNCAKDMIWYYLLLFFGSVLTAAFSWLPVVETLPLGMDDALTAMMGYFNEIKVLIPWLAIVFTAFMWYLGFRVTLLTLRLLRVIR